jgi:hypothetical protein
MAASADPGAANASRRLFSLMALGANFDNIPMIEAFNVGFARSIWRLV